MASFTKENHWNKGKSEHKFKYTYSDIARLKGLKVSTLRKYVSEGKFSPSSLESVVKFLCP